MTQVNGSSQAIAPAPPRMTYEEFLAWPHENPHVEWVDGRTVVMPPISDEHTHVGRFLINVLTQYTEARSVGTVFYDPYQMKAAPDLPGRAPDVFFVAKDNLSRVRRTHLEGPADLVVEIISPDSRARDRGEKYYEYEQGGVPEYWLIDPQRRQAEFYVLGDDRLYHAARTDDGVFHSTVLHGLWLRIEWLWNRPPWMTVLKEWGLM